jgi:nitrogen regulatory protein P-II 1
MKTMDVSLIVSIVRKGWGSTVLQASVKAGARGGTVLSGRGAGVHEKKRLFGISIEPEKEIVLTLVHSEQIDGVLASIVEAADLNEEGHGIAFVLPVDRVVGVAQFLKASSESVDE